MKNVAMATYYLYLFTKKLANSTFLMLPIILSIKKLSYSNFNLLNFI